MIFKGEKMQAREILSINKVIPVMTIYEPQSQRELAKALFEGGIGIFEITLRNEFALKAIKELRKEFKEVKIGAGTVTNAKQLNQALEAGAEFIISPGVNASFLKSTKDCGVPFIPGISSASELMLALEYGFDTLKFFPAELCGGVKMLETLAVVFPQVKFCPTGGIKPENAKAYLNLDNVLCVGGSWISNEKDIKAKNFKNISELARQSTLL